MVRTIWNTGAMPLVLLVAVSTAVGQQYKVGDEVVVVRDAEIRLPTGKVGKVFPGLVLKVEATNGKNLWILHGKAGWLDSSYVIPLDRRAVDRFTEMIRVEASKGRFHSARANVREHLGDLELALQDYNESIRIGRPSAADFNNRGALYVTLREFDKAIDDLSEGLRLEPDATAFHNRGWAWAEKGEWDKALRDVTEAIRLDPAYVNAYNIRGRAWNARKEYDKAIADFDTAIRLDAKFAVAYLNRATSWLEKGQFERALADYESVRKINPQDADAFNGFAWLRATCYDAQFRDGKRAVADAQKACELTKWTSASEMDTLGCAYAEAGDFAQAIKWGKKAADLATEPLKSEIQSHVKLFEKGQPYREELKGKAGS